MFITEEFENMDKKKTQNTQNFICSETAKVFDVQFSKSRGNCNVY